MGGLKTQNSWMAPEIRDDIRCGDMPGDKVRISKDHIRRAGLIFPKLLDQVEDIFVKEGTDQVVIAVSGGSGSGKSGIASLLSYYFGCMGIGSYTMSGDNYPHRIPFYNDGERLRIFRQSGIRELVKQGEFSKDRFDFIRALQEKDDDANAGYVSEHSWFANYLSGGISGLQAYLGTPAEIDFHEVEMVVNAFKQGQTSIWLKRMGRTETEFWYEEVDFSNTNIMIIEWTHGNSDYYQGVDIPILLNSTPQETLAYRKARNRDGQTDSAFTMMVLQLEQEMLKRQAHKAKIIVSKQGELLTFEQYTETMENERENPNE